MFIAVIIAMNIMTLITNCQLGGSMYFARSCILAIYGDHPAARKCSLTGSSCPVCYTPQKLMAQAQQEPRHNVLRNSFNMSQRKIILKRMATTGIRGANERAQKRAKREGVNLAIENAWSEEHCQNEAMVFGPHLVKDNIWQNLPQLVMHGNDEGLIVKANAGTLHETITEAKDRLGISATEVSQQCLYAFLSCTLSYDVLSSERWNVNCNILELTFERTSMDRENVQYNVHYNEHYRYDT
jgi:hypothetical protein